MFHTYPSDSVLSEQFCSRRYSTSVPLSKLITSDRSVQLKRDNDVVCSLHHSLTSQCNICNNTDNQVVSFITLQTGDLYQFPPWWVPCGSTERDLIANSFRTVLQSTGY